MKTKYVAFGAAAALALAGFASGSFGEDGAIDPSGTLYHYIRSNRDGTHPEHVYVYRAAANRIEVYKMVRRCADAAFVSAWVDPDSGRASMITGGRLMPQGRHENFALLRYSSHNGRIDAEAALPGGAVSGEIFVDTPNWHLFDFDLATLSLQTMALDDPRTGFAFEMPLVSTEGGDDDFVRNLGRAEAVFVRAEDYRGTPALRFEVGGQALGSNGGPLWLDAETHHVIGAAWGVPNHAGMDDFALRLVDTSAAGDVGWQALLARHFEGCAVA